MPKVKCRPVRTGKPGPRRVKIKAHTRTRPKAIKKKC